MLRLGNWNCRALVKSIVALALLLPALAAQSQDNRSVDLYGDPLPAGALARLGTIRYRNPSRYTRVEFVPGTDTYVVVAPREKLRFCDARTGRFVRKFTFGDARIQAFDISVDGTSVVTLSALRLGDGGRNRTCVLAKIAEKRGACYGSSVSTMPGIRGTGVSRNRRWRLSITTSSGDSSYYE